MKKYFLKMPQESWQRCSLVVCYQKVRKCFFLRFLLSMLERQLIMVCTYCVHIIFQDKIPFRVRSKFYMVTTSFKFSKHLASKTLSILDSKYLESEQKKRNTNGFKSGSNILGQSSSKVFR